MKLRFEGEWSRLSDADRRALLERSSGVDDETRRVTARIIADVRARGDAALCDLSARYDNAHLDALEVPRSALDDALARVPAALRSVMERAIANITAVHEAFAPRPAEVHPEPGITVGRRPDPLARIGVYAPGGRAAYASTVLMTVVPARVAGVGEIVVASPPTPSGAPSQSVLAAAALAGADRVFAIGGAGAIAAMAYGTQSVPRADRIVGPGNGYVSAAKALVAGDVAIDCPAGPSELLVIADASSSAETVAAEMVAQAEHDPDASVVAVVTDAVLATELRCALERRASVAARRGVVLAALALRGGILIARDLAEAITVANEYAPEHLLLATDAACDLLPSVRNAGSIFLGESSSVAFGDYMTGANHVLPTGGSARGYSGLSPQDFVRWTTWQRVERAAALSLANDVATFAHAESLPAHADAAARWAEGA
jgi:histidinol dehydrogenase